MGTFVVFMGKEKTVVFIISTQIDVLTVLDFVSFRPIGLQHNSFFFVSKAFLEKEDSKNL